jgi:hypothetical protein
VFVASRLARHGAGVRMSLAETTPEMLADAIVAQLGHRGVSPPFAVDGASNAARHIAAALERGAP